MAATPSDNFLGQILNHLCSFFGVHSVEVVYQMELETEGHTYIIRFTKDNALEALRQLGRWASDSELPFSQRDYTIAAEKIREALK